MSNSKKISCLGVATLVCLFSLGMIAFGDPARAAGIDPDNDGSRFAWGENVGWLNFRPIHDDLSSYVDVADDHLSGMVWGENIGWIALSCTNCANVSFGVTNDGLGNLSGYTWGENVGWISFSCQNTSSCAHV